MSDQLLNTGYYNGSLHDSAVASDGTDYWVTRQPGTQMRPSVDMFTAGDFSGPRPELQARHWQGRPDGVTCPARRTILRAAAGASSGLSLNEKPSGRVYAAWLGSNASGRTMNFFDPDGPGPIASIPLNSATADTNKGFAVVYDASTWAVLQAVVWESAQGGDVSRISWRRPDGGFVIRGNTKGTLGRRAEPVARDERRLHPEIQCRGRPGLGLPDPDRLCRQLRRHVARRGRQHLCFRQRDQCHR